MAAGEFATLIGPSGSGKTSILRVVTGLLAARRGTVELDVGLRDVGFLFQGRRAAPVAYGARERGAGGCASARLRRPPRPSTADRWLRVLGLGGYGDRYPGQLSGGQRKRVAIAQVLALRPRLLLMDEPFAALDAIVRTRMTQELLEWVERERLTVLLVTHDLEEAISASDVVHVLGHGPRAAIRASHRVGIPRPAARAGGARASRLRAAPAAPLGRAGGGTAAGAGDVMTGRRGSPLVRRGAALLSVLTAWEAASRAGVLDPFYAPPPTAVAGVMFTLAAGGELWPHLAATAAAAFAGLLAGLVLGIALGFAAALAPLVADLLEPVMILLNAIPRVILAPLFVIWLGIGLASKLALATILVTVLIFFAVYNGFREVDRATGRAGSGTLGGGTADAGARGVRAVGHEAGCSGASRSPWGFAFTGAVVGEFVASSRGLGYLLQFAQSTYNAALTIALIFTIMAVVLLLFRRRRTDRAAPAALALPLRAARLLGEAGEARQLDDRERADHQHDENPQHVDEPGIPEPAHNVGAVRDDQQQHEQDGQDHRVRRLRHDDHLVGRFRRTARRTARR